MQELIDIIKPIATKRVIKKHTITFYQGEIPRAAIMMVSGLMKVYSINSSGEEQIVTFRIKGDLFPIPWIFSQSTNSLFYYEALSDCEVLVLPKEELLKVIRNNPKIFQRVFDYFASHYTGMLLRVTALEQSRAIEKILFTLYYLVFHYGKETNKPGLFTIDLKLTQPIIAAMVGLTRETTAKNLNQLKRRGIINYKEYRYTIDKTKLERYMGEDNFKSLKLK
jgi:CRP-like cAMP-binding protein